MRVVRSTLRQMALVCLCYGVNERRVRREIEHGAASIEEVAERCHAGSGCLGCHPTIDRLLTEHGSTSPPSAHPAGASAWPERRDIGCSAMRGDVDIIELLNDVLTAELTAINQYFIHAKMCENWGYHRLASHGRDESIDEMKHAERLIERILYFDGVPNMQRLFPVRVGETVPEQFDVDLRARVHGRRALQPGHRPGRRAAVTTALANCSPRSSCPRRSTSTGWRRSRRRSARSASSSTSPSSSTSRRPPRSRMVAHAPRRAKMTRRGTTPRRGHHVEISVTVNGSTHTHDVEPRTLLVHYIREQVGLTGTNIGCDTSSCGACTLHLDGESVKSCTVLAVQADGADITTIEGPGHRRRSCTRCSRRSWRTTACSAGTARLAW